MDHSDNKRGNLLLPTGVTESESCLWDGAFLKEPFLLIEKSTPGFLFYDWNGL